jgi:hypothetical protein
MYISFIYLYNYSNMLLLHARADTLKPAPLVLAASRAPCKRGADQQFHLYRKIRSTLQHRCTTIRDTQQPPVENPSLGTS